MLRFFTKRMFASALFSVLSLCCLCEEPQIVAVLELRCTYFNPHATGAQIKRIPPLRYAYFDGGELSFIAFSSECVMEVVDDNGLVVYSQTLEDGASKCKIPIPIKSEYVVQFVFNDFMYWGRIYL